jgi:hypothetical protein
VPTALIRTLLLGLLLKAAPFHIRDQFEESKFGIPQLTPYTPGANRFDPHTQKGHITWKHNQNKKVNLAV